MTVLPSISWSNYGLSLSEDELENSSEANYKPIASKFVNRDILNIRDKPINGSIVGQLKRGESIFVYDRKGEWERITSNNEPPKWILSTLLCSSIDCYKKANVRTSNYNLASKLPNSSSSKPTSSSYGNSSCPCSGSSNCFGPRGGSFCYTSGGNKRYR